MRINEENESDHILLSEHEIDIINTVINSIHNDKNTIYLRETFYAGGFLFIESLRSGMLKELKSKDNIDNIIIQSFEKNNSIENLKKENTIDKNNQFNFDFIWYDWREYIGKNKILINNYEEISFSRIGFNKNQTEAIIFLEVEFEKTGYGKIYLLERKFEKWDIKKIIDIHGLIKGGGKDTDCM